jgi:hypothetical protein
MSWHRVNKHIMAFLDKLAPERFRRVRAEDLLGHPDKHLYEISEWLGLRSDPQAVEEMKHPERSPFAFIGPPTAPGGGDGKFFKNPVLRQPGPHTHRLNEPLPWRKDGKGLRDEVRELAHAFGYS